MASSASNMASIVIPVGEAANSSASNVYTPARLLARSAKRKVAAPAYEDISDRGKWSVSSYKFGFGAECLRDNDPETFWHSDGPQPHSITVEFPRKVAIQKLSILLNFSKDDSYTPSALAIRAGTGRNDLQDVRIFTLDKPDGWTTFDVSTEPNEEGDGYKTVQAYVVQVIIAANHLSGKDTHVRGLKILGPEEEYVDDGDPFPFQTLRFQKYETIR